MKTRGHAARSAAFAAAFLLGAAPAFADGNASISGDFSAMSSWLSHQLAQGLGFNAGETFDPPHELTSRRLQPDVSVGGGMMPLNQQQFPQTPALTNNGVDSKGIFPSSVLFPNLSMHMRAGLPGRMDFSLRFDDMTTPPGYKISSTVTGKGQSNSIGFGLRKHFLGGDSLPLLSLGANFNHVFGNFSLHTTRDFIANNSIGIDSNVDGKLVWNVSSYGLNLVMSRPYKGWTPFLGCGYNYVTGSASAQLAMAPVTPTTVESPSQGGGSNHPEQNQARAIAGLEMTLPWMHFFANGEIKAVGENAGRSWITQVGAALPFEISLSLVSKRSERSKDEVVSTAPYGDYVLPGEKAPVKKRAPVPQPARDKRAAEMVFIQ